MALDQTALQITACKIRLAWADATFSRQTGANCDYSDLLMDWKTPAVGRIAGELMHEHPRHSSHLMLLPRALAAEDGPRNK